MKGDGALPDHGTRAFTRIGRAGHGRAWMMGAAPQPPTDLANWMAGKSYMIVPLVGFDQRQTYLLMESGPTGEALLPLSFSSLDGALRAKAEMEEAASAGQAAAGAGPDGDRDGRG